MAMTLDGSNGVTFNDSSLQGAAASPFGLKNRIINGDMVVSQRSGTSVISVTGYTLDRWVADASQASKYTVQQNAGSVTPPTGFTNYLGVTSTAATSLAAGDYFLINQSIEGFNVADLGWGAAGAATVTISFWVRSSLTGTFAGSVRNANADRSYPFNYTISSANTWTKISVTIPGDTTGTWVKNNGTGLILSFSIGTGSTFSGTAGAWTAGNFVSATGATSVVGTNGATWYITGVQLERNTTATPFEWLPYSTELALCQRYFYSMGGNQAFEHFASISQTASTDGRGILFLPVTMRTVPSVGQSGSFSINSGTASITGTFSAGTTMYLNIGGNFGGLQNIGFDFWTGTAGSYNQAAGSMWILRANGSTATRLTFSAEL